MDNFHRPLTFGQLFKKYRLLSGFDTASEFCEKLAEKGYPFEDSIVYKWQKDVRVPKDRKLVIAMAHVFIEFDSIKTAEQIDKFLESAEMKHLALYELNELNKKSKGLKKHVIENFSHINNTEFDRFNHIFNELLSSFPFYKNKYKIAVLSLSNQTTRTLDRIAISKTSSANKVLKMSPVPFKEIRIPSVYTQNLLCEVVNKKHILITENIHNILTPIFTKNEAAEMQLSANIKSIVAIPLKIGKSVSGVINFSTDNARERISSQSLKELEDFAKILSISLS